MASPALAAAIDDVIAKMRNSQNLPLAEKTKKDYRREVRRALEVVPAESIDALQQCQRILAAINDGEPPYNKVISLGAKCKAMCTLVSRNFWANRRRRH